MKILERIKKSNCIGCLTSGLLVFSLGSPQTHAQTAANDCFVCLKEAASTLGSDVATNAVLGALGGGVLGGGLPGAVCGGVIGAASGLASNVKDVLKCETVCKEQGNQKKDKEVNKCNDLADKLKAK